MSAAPETGATRRRSGIGSVEDFPPRASPFAATNVTAPVIIIIVIFIARPKTLRALLRLLGSHEQPFELPAIEPNTAASFTPVERDAVAIELVERYTRTTWTLHRNLQCEPT
jgi:hypothetical protein